MGNLWNTNSEAQKYWINKWNRENAVCEGCEKHGKCTAIDRMNTHVCQNLYERLGNHYTHKPA